MKYIYAIFLAGLAFMLSCGREPDPSVEAGAGLEPIRVTSGGSIDYDIVTRSDIMTMRSQGIGLIGYNTAGEPFDPDSPGTPVIDNYKLTSADGAGWEYADKVAFWNVSSDDKYTFFSYHPYREDQSVILPVPADGTVIGECIDYLVALPVVDQTEKNGVRLNFSHIFSKLTASVRLGAAYAGQNYVLRKVTFNDVREYPSFSMPENDFDRTEVILHDIESETEDITGTLSSLSDVVSVNPIYISPYDYASQGKAITVAFDFEYIFTGGDEPVSNTFTKEIAVSEDFLDNHAYNLNVTFNPDKEGGIDISVSLDGYQMTEDMDFEVQQSPPPPVSLSDDGTANCYIVPGAGRYSFDATYRGNSTSEAVGDIASAEVLWESAIDAVNTGDLIRNVSADGNVISFDAGDLKGNALIAAKDDAGTVLWSWHIWLTDPPAEQTYRNGAGTVMDRNLGATSADRADGQETYGLYYQWGRKEPFVGQDAQLKIATTNPHTLGDNSRRQSSDWAARNPTVFIRNNGEWITTIDDYRWNSETGGKTLNDPCPHGYRVPDGGTDDLWAKASGMRGALDSGLPDFDGGMDFGSKNGSSVQFTDDDTCWYPAAGYIFYGGGMHGPPMFGSYLTNIHNVSGSNNSFVMYFRKYDTGAVSFEISSKLGCAYGQSVRCVKE